MLSWDLQIPPKKPECGHTAVTPALGGRQVDARSPRQASQQNHELHVKWRPHSKEKRKSERVGNLVSSSVLHDHIYTHHTIRKKLKILFILFLCIRETEISARIELYKQTKTNSKKRKRKKKSRATAEGQGRNQRLLGTISTSIPLPWVGHKD